MHTTEEEGGTCWPPPRRDEENTIENCRQRQSIYIQKKRK